MKTAIIIITSLVVVSCSNRSLTNNTTLTTTTPTVQYSKSTDGAFHETIVVQGTLSQKELLTAEHKYISDHYGARGEDWFLVSQTIIKEENRIYDVVEITGNNSSVQNIVFFDVTEAFSDFSDIANKSSATTRLVAYRKRP